MPVKSVIDIEVNDEAFKDFAALFDRYRTALGGTPSQWAAANAGAAGTALSVENLVAGLLAHEEVNRKIARTDAERTRQLERQARIMRGFAPSFRDVAKSVANITAGVAKWVFRSGVFGGLLGYGGLLGIDRLALGVGYDRRRAQGLGVSVGEEKAFGNAYGRLVDPASFLGGVSEAMTDVTKRPAFFGAGLGESDLAGRNTAQVADRLLLQLKRIADRTPDALLGNVAAARGLTQFATVEDLRRLKATSPEELESIRRRYAAGTKTFNLRDDVARRWQDLGVSLDAAKLKIESVFVRGLAPLTGPLEKLSGSVAKALENFLTGIKPETIKGIGRGIEDFGKYLGSESFRTDVKNFAEDVSYAAKKIAGVLQWLGLLPDRAPDAVKNAEAESNRAQNMVDGGDRPVDYADSSLRNRNPNRPARWWDPGSWWSRNGGIGSILDKLAVNDKVLDAVEWKESRGNAKAVGPQTKYGRAQGAYQLMPATARQYGVRNPFDKAESREGARRYLIDLTRKYDGDLVKALAAYNWGPGNLDRSLAKSAKDGVDWRSRLPAETKDYVASIAKRIGANVEIKGLVKGDAEKPVVERAPSKPGADKPVVERAPSKPDGAKPPAKADAPKIVSREVRERAKAASAVVRDVRVVAKAEPVRVQVEGAKALARVEGSSRRSDPRPPASAPAPVPRAAPSKPVRARVDVTVMNNTGGSAIVQTSALAKQS